jgi:RHS repeat-associated protein
MNLTDHLGNVRAVIGKPLVVEYLATMESERSAKERTDQMGDFDNVHNDPTATDFNHTPGTVTVNGATETISDPNEVIRMNNMPVSGDPTSPVGTGIMLWVHPGDVIDAEIFAKYTDFNSSNQSAITAIANHLINALGVAPSAIDGSSIFDVVETPEFLNSGVWNKLDDEQPRAFLNYLLFDNNNLLQENGFDFDQVSADAKIIGSVTSHERLSLQINVEKEGYIYIYVSNQSNQNTEVYFDDLKITHNYSEIVGGADFYPFGLTIEDRQIQREFYRHGYQGQFSEKDEETGWNHFELREYDPEIGRWLRVDPYRQYMSPYIGLGNDPINMVDPDGGIGGPVYKKPKPFKYEFELRHLLGYKDLQEIEITPTTLDKLQDVGYAYVQIFEPEIYANAMIKGSKEVFINGEMLKITLPVVGYGLSYSKDGFEEGMILANNGYISYKDPGGLIEYRVYPTQGDRVVGEDANFRVLVMLHPRPVGKNPSLKAQGDLTVDVNGDAHFGARVVGEFKIDKAGKSSIEVSAGVRAKKPAFIRLWTPLLTPNGLR